MANDWTDGNLSGLWSDPLNWSLSHVPTVGEDVTFSSSTDACSVDVDIAAINSITISVNVTITVNAVQTTTFGAMAISATGVFNSNGQSTITITSLNISTATAYLVMGTSNWSCSGNWISASTSASYSYGTSTVTLTGTGNLRCGPFAYGTAGFYNLVIAVGAVISITTNNCRIKNTVVINGELKDPTVSYLLVLYESIGTNITPLTLGVGAVTSTLQLYYGCNSNYNVSGGTFASLVVLSTIGTVTCTLQGNLFMFGLLSSQTSGGTLTIFDTGGFTISGTAALQTLGGAIKCNNSSITINSFSANLATDYLVMNTSTWNVAGNWTNASTSASWSYGTSTINFNGTLAQTLGLNNGNSANIGYYNITISNSGAVNVVMGANNISIHGLFHITSATCTVTETANNPTYTISGSITKETGSTWTRGTGLMTITSNPGTITDNGAVKTDMKDITVNTAGTVTFVTCYLTSTTLHIVAGTVVTASSTIVWAYLLAPGATWTKTGAGGAQMSIGNLQIDAGAELITGDPTPIRSIGNPGLMKWSVT